MFLWLCIHVFVRLLVKSCCFKPLQNPSKCSSCYIQIKLCALWASVGRVNSLQHVVTEFGINASFQLIYLCLTMNKGDLWGDRARRPVAQCLQTRHALMKRRPTRGVHAITQGRSSMHLRCHHSLINQHRLHG